MKNILLACLALTLFASSSLAADKVNWRRVEASPSPVAAGDEIGIRYLTGLPEIDQTTRCYSYNVRLAFDERDAVLKRNRIDQAQGKGVEEVEVARIPYASIKELLFGYDAAYASQEGKLATAQQQSCNYPNITMALQMLKYPVALLFEQGGKPTSFVFIAREDDALRLYEGLASRAKITTHPPLAYKGIIKQRAKLDPPPPDSER
jgi:hypothetical protein